MLTFFEEVTMERMYVCLSVVVVLCLAGSSYAAVNWTGAGLNDSWDLVGNWDTRVPLASDSTYVKASSMSGSTVGPVISSTGSACRNLSVEVGAATEITMEMTGGTLDLYFAGASNCYFRLGAGASSGTAIFNMSGGTLTVDVDSNLYASGSNGYVRVGYGYNGAITMTDDAAIYAWDLLIGAGTDGVDLSDDAMIVLKGDDTSAIEDFITGGVLTSNGRTVNNVTYSYDEQTGLTTITAIPEPATLLLLGLGGLAMIRRKR